jgi:hypothetical protein
VGRPFVRSCDASSIACRWNSFEVTGERSDERRHCRQPLRPRTLRSALSTPAAHQRLIILPSRHRFTFLVVSRAIEIMLSMQFCS